MLRKKVAVFFAVVVCGSLTGCASTRTLYTNPTQTELEAVRPFKKTIAVLIVNETGSAPFAFQKSASTVLEEELYPRYNLIDRRDVLRVVSDPRWSGLREQDFAIGLGKELHADYALFATVHTTSSLPPQINQLASVCAETTASVNLYDVSKGKIEYADTLSREFCHEEKLDTLGLLNGSQPSADDIYKVFKDSTRINQIYPRVLTNARSRAVSAIAGRVKRLNPLEGEVLQVLSDHEVIINLGSAYGVRPRDEFSVAGSRSGCALKDPKTGLMIESKEIISYVKVRKVTSGISSIAEGDKKVVADMKVGDKVTSA